MVIPLSVSSIAMYKFDFAISFLMLISILIIFLLCCYKKVELKNIFIDFKDVLCKIELLKYLKIVFKKLYESIFNDTTETKFFFKNVNGNNTVINIKNITTKNTTIINAENITINGKI